MDSSKLISNTINFEGTDIKFTWYPGKNLDNYQPFTQVYGVVFDSSGMILIQRRDGCDWCLPGGTVEHLETAEQTLRREVVEESDVTINNPILLGGQRVQFPGGHNPNPSKRGGDDFFQLRYYCEVDEIMIQTPDPDHGTINERMFVNPNKINTYLNWGVTGQVIFDQAIALYRELHLRQSGE